MTIRFNIALNLVLKSTSLSKLIVTRERFFAYRLESTIITHIDVSNWVSNEVIRESLKSVLAKDVLARA